jgi:UDP-glucose 4-epimerase
VTPRAWVIGAGGLLGSAVAGELRRREVDSLVERLPWDDAVELDLRFRAHVRTVAASSGDWTIFWCAGAGVIGTTPERLEDELRSLESFFDAVEAESTSGQRRRGAIFLASSAGGVYAGSQGLPFTEETVPEPTSPYGNAKLRAEQIALDRGQRLGIPVFIGRIANLYGPGQSLAKPQGLVSQLCRSMLGGPPTGIYVSLDTIRDYLWSEDAARMIVDGIELVHRDRSAATMKILASGTGVTISTLLGVVRWVFKRRPNVALAVSPNAAFQTRDLRFRSVVLTELDARPFTPLPVALATIAQSIREGQSASSSPSR